VGVGAIVGVGVVVGVSRGVGVFVVVGVGRDVGLGKESVGEGVTVGVASSVAAGVSNAVAVGVAVTTHGGIEVCIRCSATPRVGSAPPQAEAIMAPTIKAVIQATTGPCRSRFLSRAGSHAREPAALRLRPSALLRTSSGQAWELPLLGIRDLLGFNLHPMLELVANLP
jgi:hypothetical protein